MKQHLSETEKKVLEVLRSNARLPVRKISRMCGISPSTVSRIIRRIEKNGMVKGYVAIIDEKEQGYDCCMMFFIRVKSGCNADHTAKQIAAMNQTCMCLTVAGNYDIIALMSCTNSRDVSNMKNILRGLKGVDVVDSSFVTERYKLMSKALAPANRIPQSSKSFMAFT